MKIDHRCRWVQRRLPLLAGGELGVEERRKVERHLIGCPCCRERRESSVGALTALRMVGEASPSSVDAPSLWPSLAQQIRQSRHSAPRPSWWEAPLTRPWGLATLAAAFGVALVASIPASTPLDPDEMAPSVVGHEIVGPAPLIATEAPMDEPEPADRSTPPPRRGGALPEAPPARLSQAPIKPIEPPSASLRFDYDLDHGTPMTPGNHDPQRTF